MDGMDIGIKSYDSTEEFGTALALGPTMTVGRSTTTSTVLTCSCCELPEILEPSKD